MTCSHGNERLAGDAEDPHHCARCGSEVAHCSSKEPTSDYHVCCLNPECIFHLGADVGDQDCPDWAHG